MDFNKARTFVEVVDRGGITAAASRLKRTQQAISAQIGNLEEDLGIALFIRQGPNITLTADGERLHRAFKDHLTAIEGTVQQLKTDKSKVSGAIRLGAWLEVSDYYLPKIISEFSEKYPLVDFEIHTATDEDLEPMLIANAIDLSFQLFTRQKRILRQVPAVHETFTPTVSQTFVEIHGLPETIEATLGLPIIDYPVKYSHYDYWIKKNRPDLSPKMQKKPPFIQTSNNTTQKQLVLQGLGIGFLMQSTIQSELQSGELIALTFDEETDANWSEIDLVYKRQNSLGFIHKEFIQHVLETRNIPAGPKTYQRHPKTN